jgi:hypothetical protein
MRPAMRATPPTTPPTMGPMGVLEEGAAVGTGVGEREEELGLEEVDGVVWVADGVEELDVRGVVVGAERMVVNQAASVWPR